MEVINKGDLQLTKKSIAFPKGKKLEDVQYQKIKSQYQRVKNAIDHKNALEIIFSESLISQKTINAVMNDLFGVECLDQKFKINLTQLETLKLTIYQTQLTDLDFLSHFFNLATLKKIEVQCDLNIAQTLFIAVSNWDEKTFAIECNGYFTKVEKEYEIECPYILIDSKVKGIHGQISSLNLRLTENNFQDCIDTLKQLTSTRRIVVDINSFKDVSEDFQLLIKTMSEHMLCLNDATFNIYLEQFLPHIDKSLFKQQLKLTYNYQYLLFPLSIKDVFRKNHLFAAYNDTLIIQPISQFQDHKLKLNFDKRNLNEEELTDINTFFSKTNHNLKEVEIKFDHNQQIALKLWVGLMNIFRTHKQLKTIIVQGSTIGPSVAALCVAKLYKCKKTYIQIKLSSFISNALTLNLYQLYDKNIDTITDNLFELKEVSDLTAIKKVDILAQSILGLTKPLSTFFSKCAYLIDLVKVDIFNEFDIHLQFFEVLKDREAMHQFVGQFQFIQMMVLINYLSTSQLFFYNMSKIYGLESAYEMGIIQQIPPAIILTLKKALAYHKDIDDESTDECLERYKIYCLYRKLVQIQRYNITQPPVMLAFYTNIAPFLPLNPYQVYTDLFID